MTLAYLGRKLVFWSWKKPNPKLTKFTNPKTQFGTFIPCFMVGLARVWIFHSRCPNPSTLWNPSKWHRETPAQKVRRKESDDMQLHWFARADKRATLDGLFSSACSFSLHLRAPRCKRPKIEYSQLNWAEGFIMLSSVHESLRHSSIEHWNSSLESPLFHPHVWLAFDGPLWRAITSSTG